MAKFLKFISLRTKLFVVLIAALIVAAAVFAGVRELGNFLVWRNYLDEKNLQERADAHVKNFQEYVKNNKLSVKDTERISSWDAGSYVDMIIYKDSTLFYAPDWFKDFNDDSDTESVTSETRETFESAVGGEETANDGATDSASESGAFDETESEENESSDEALNESVESSSDEWLSETDSGVVDFVDQGWFSGDRGFVQYLTKEARETYLNRLGDILEGNNALTPIYFVDGTLFVVVVDYTEEFLNGLVFVISIVSALLVLGIIMMLYFNNTTLRIKKLANNVREVESGKLDMPIKATGNDEISALAKDVNSMRNSVVDNMTKERQAWEANTGLITAMSHDIRTPLTVLLGYLDLAELQNEDPSCAEYIASCKENAIRLKNLSDDMFSYFLVFGQNDSISGTVVAEDVETLKQMISERTLLLEEKGFAFCQAYDVSDVKMLADLAYLGRIVDNVFSNIAKYAYVDSPVTIGMNTEDDKLVISFKNKIRKDDSSPESNHIGIKTCIRIMEKMGGSFSVDSDGEDFVATVRMLIQKEEK